MADDILDILFDDCKKCQNYIHNIKEKLSEVDDPHFLDSEFLSGARKNNFIEFKKILFSRINYVLDCEDRILDIRSMYIDKKIEIEKLEKQLKELKPADPSEKKKTPSQKEYSTEHRYLR